MPLLMSSAQKRRLRNAGAAVLPAVIARSLAENHARVIDLFRALDTDSDGAITRREFASLFERLDIPVSRFEQSALFDVLDPDGSGTIEFRELQAAIIAASRGVESGLEWRNVPSESPSSAHVRFDRVEIDPYEVSPPRRTTSVGVGVGHPAAIGNGGVGRYSPRGSGRRAAPAAATPPSRVGAANGAKQVPPPPFSSAAVALSADGTAPTAVDGEARFDVAASSAAQSALCARALQGEVIAELQTQVEALHEQMGSLLRELPSRLRESVGALHSAVKEGGRAREEALRKEIAVEAARLRSEAAAAREASSSQAAWLESRANDEAARGRAAQSSLEQLDARIEQHVEPRLSSIEARLGSGFDLWARGSGVEQQLRDQAAIISAQQGALEVHRIAIDELRAERAGMFSRLARINEAEVLPRLAKLEQAEAAHDKFFEARMDSRLETTRSEMQALVSRVERAESHETRIHTAAAHVEEVGHELTRRFDELHARMRPAVLERVEDEMTRLGTRLAALDASREEALAAVTRYANKVDRAVEESMAARGAADAATSAAAAARTVADTAAAAAAAARAATEDTAGVLSRAHADAERRVSALEAVGTSARISAVERGLSSETAERMQGEQRLEGAKATKVETETLRVTLKSEVDSFKTSVLKETGELKAATLKEADDLKVAVLKDTDELRAALRNQTDELRASLQKETAELRAQLGDETGALRSSLTTAKGDLGVQIQKAIATAETAEYGVDRVRDTIGERFGALEQTLRATVVQSNKLTERVQSTATLAELEEMRSLLANCVLREESIEMNKRILAGAKMDALRGTQRALESGLTSLGFDASLVREKSSPEQRAASIVGAVGAAATAAVATPDSMRPAACAVPLVSPSPSQCSQPLVERLHTPPSPGYEAGAVPAAAAAPPQKRTAGGKTSLESRVEAQLARCNAMLVGRK